MSFSDIVIILTAQKKAGHFQSLKPQVNR